MRQATYCAGALLYLFTVGCCYAMFTAVVLEFLGDSGKSGGTRYSIIKSLGNTPVLYMLQVDGWGGEHCGGRGSGWRGRSGGSDRRVGATHVVADPQTRTRVCRDRAGNCPRTLKWGLQNSRPKAAVHSDCPTAEGSDADIHRSVRDAAGRPELPWLLWAPKGANRRLPRHERATATVAPRVSKCGKRRATH